MQSMCTAIKVLTASSGAEKGVKHGQMMLEMSGNCKTQPKQQPEHAQGDAHDLTRIVRQRKISTANEINIRRAAENTPSLSPLGRT